MRENRGPIDTSELPWQQSNAAVSVKLLNGNRQEGPHTMILRSEPREPNAPRGQFHPADEELFCLAGDFTFDGSTWLSAGSYAFFPAYVVHGTKVHVRGGYELYVRISDTNSLFWDNDPKSDIPYVAAGHKAAEQYIQLEDVRQSFEQSASSDIDGVKAKALHDGPDASDRTTLIAFSQHAPAVILESAEMVEAISLSGSFRMADEGAMPARSYVCSLPTDPSTAASLIVECLEDGELLVSHSSELRIAQV